MKKKTKASRRRLNNLLMILLLTAVLLIMSTYAWFTSNRTVNIDKLEVKVNASSGLQISVDAKDWRTVLTKTQIDAAHETYENSVNQLPEYMAPVSSALELDADGKMKMFFGQVEADLTDGSPTYGEYLLTTVQQADVESSDITTTGQYDKGYYIAFDVFLKVDADSPNLYFSGSVIEPVTDKGLANSSRVALIKGPNTAASDSDPEADMQTLTTAGGTVMMWEPNSDAHKAGGVNNAAALGWDSTLSVGEGNPTVPYDGVKGEVAGVVLSQATAAQDATNFARITPTWATPKTGLPSMEVEGGLDAGVSKFRIYLWVEGQDVDCENNASGTDVQYNLSFSLDPFEGAAAGG